MAIDPQAQGILAMFAGFPEPDYSTLDVTAYRAIDAQRSVPSLNEAVSHIADHVITAPAGPMTLRLYHPAPGSVLPAIVFFSRRRLGVLRARHARQPVSSAGQPERMRGDFGRLSTRA
ncbi:hypothetical protein ACFS07_20880 [Undibacterium arcticum]